MMSSQQSCVSPTENCTAYHWYVICDNFKSDNLSLALIDKSGDNSGILLSNCIKKTSNKNDAIPDCADCADIILS